jgi:hypothetical protein
MFECFVVLLAGLLTFVDDGDERRQPVDDLLLALDAFL